jgi:hypothetical protein
MGSGVQAGRQQMFNKKETLQDHPWVVWSSSSESRLGEPQNPNLVVFQELLSKSAEI